MATASEVKAGLDDIAAAIRASRQQAIRAKAQISTADSALAGLPITFADVVATINGYDAGAGPFEALAKAELARLVVEYQALKVKTDDAKSDLAAIDFTT